MLIAPEVSGRRFSRQCERPAQNPDETKLNHRSFVAGGAGLISRKQIPRLDPVPCSFENFSGVRFKNQPLSRTEGSDINHAVISLRQLLEKVVLIDLWFHINILLGSAQGFEITVHIFRVWFERKQMTDHQR